MMLAYRRKPMKPGYILLAALVSLSPIASAQMMGHGHGASTKEAAAHRAAGVVKSVDAEKGTLTVAHGPIATLNWPAMTMSFKSPDKAALREIKPGAKLDFEFEQRGKDYVITKIR